MFDSPSIPVVVGKRVRKRLDPKSILQLLQSLDAPAGTFGSLILCGIIDLRGFDGSR